MRRIRDALGDDSDAEQLLAALVGALESSSVEYLPLHFLRTLLPDHTRSGVFQVAVLLTKSSLGFLELHFEYDDINGESHSLSEDAGLDALDQGVLWDRFGRRYDDVRNRLRPYFVGTDLLRDLVSTNHSGSLS